jgi:hypothetical protein
MEFTCPHRSALRAGRVLHTGTFSSGSIQIHTGSSKLGQNSSTRCSLKLAFSASSILLRVVAGLPTRMLPRTGSVLGIAQSVQHE